MLSTCTLSALDKIMLLLTDVEVKSVPRIIVVDSDWRKTITNAITLDKGIMKGEKFIVTVQFASMNTLQQKGSLELSLHNVLASMDKPSNMVVTVENIVTKFVKGRKLEQTFKLSYIVIRK